MSIRIMLQQIGFLSIVTATGLFAASIGIAAETPIVTNTPSSTVATGSQPNDYKVKALQDGLWQVVDSHGNVFFLSEATKGQKTIGRPYSYTPNMSH